jgi:hypothetical protein
MTSVKFNDIPPHDNETAAITWVIHKYIEVCEWQSVVNCFNDYAAMIASNDPLAYISCIRCALVAIINCQDSRCILQGESAIVLVL